MNHGAPPAGIARYEKTVVFEADEHGVAEVVLDPHPASLLGADLADPALEYHLVIAPRRKFRDRDGHGIDGAGVAVGMPALFQCLMCGMTTTAA
jgi:hypothetical protein